MAYLLVFSGNPAPCLSVAGVAASSKTYVDFWIKEQISKKWVWFMAILLMLFWPLKAG